MEEFTWAFGEDTVEEIEKRVHLVLENIQKMPDLENLAEQGLEKYMETWHSLGVIDEDEFLRRMELHMDELSKNLSAQDNRAVILELIEETTQDHGTGTKGTSGGLRTFRGKPCPLRAQIGKTESGGSKTSA